jgi:hypothetical protein
LYGQIETEPEAQSVAQYEKHFGLITGAAEGSLDRTWTLPRDRLGEKADECKAVSRCGSPWRVRIWIIRKRTLPDNSKAGARGLLRV